MRQDIKRTCKAADEDSKEGNFISETLPKGGEFELREAVGIEAVLGQRLMALGTSLMRLVAAQLVRVAGLAAHRCVRYSHLTGTLCADANCPTPLRFGDK